MSSARKHKVVKHGGYLFVHYTELLRRAWLNPSYKPWQKDVHDFEYEHHNELKSYFSEWQRNGRGDRRPNTETFRVRNLPGTR